MQKTIFVKQILQVIDGRTVCCPELEENIDRWMHRYICGTWVDRKIQINVDTACYCKNFGVAEVRSVMADPKNT